MGIMEHKMETIGIILYLEVAGICDPCLGALDVGPCYTRV